jgi:hypothetical protein
LNSSLLVQLLRKRPHVPTAQLLSELGVSRATLMRAVRAAGDAVLTVGRARRTRYAARRLLRGSSLPLPVFSVDESGGSHQVGRLHLAYPGGCWLELLTPSVWPLDADMRDGWHDGIPYMLQDLRPTGFLGRAFARERAAVLQVSEDLLRWSDDDALFALSLFGTDAPGDLILGEGAYRRWLASLQQPLERVSDAQLAEAYPHKAAQAMQYGTADSSAGGEFPKFTAVRDIAGTPVPVVEHVLVKFSGSDDSPSTQRWADLLVCEALASQCLADMPGIAPATSRIHQAAGRTFLEVARFDRHGAHGRSPLCSWAAINHAWFGLAGHSWAQGAMQMHARGLISPNTVDAIAQLWFFGQLIANSDMHDGNLSFTPSAGGFQLAPVYDMLPMQYAPQRGVELPERSFPVHLPLPSERPHWRAAAHAALRFWQLASQDSRISAGFRVICANNALALEQAMRLAAVGG